ncbi:hypothetical protein EVAR_22438_1 [Eumeta japonica]|uniref:Uncharacterized protein n=1 Tax=Eumeta variegata TaxID=151549 RepID=A0A4C1ZY01_EUMVA|nr:hypothetical protein EVAR_22438_1 [Eumeta japonica]
MAWMFVDSWAGCTDFGVHSRISFVDGYRPLINMNKIVWMFDGRLDGLLGTLDAGDVGLTADSWFADCNRTLDSRSDAGG